MRKVSRYLSAAVAVSAAFFVPPAQAQQLVCGDYDMAIALLKKTHHEDLKYRAATRHGRLLELWVSDRGTWTALIVPRPGLACGLVDGDGFVAVAPPVAHPTGPRS